MVPRVLRQSHCHREWQENGKRMEVTGIRMEVIPHMNDPVLYPIRPGRKDFTYKSLRLEPDPRIGPQIQVLDSCDIEALNPILKLVIMDRVPLIAERLTLLRPRLLADTTILRFQTGIYLWLDLCRTIFQDLKTRPTSIPGIITHSFDSKDTHHKIRSGGYAISEESLDIRRRTKDLFTSKWNGEGNVAIGDIDSVPGYETASMLAMRRRIVRPMINTLHSCRKLVVQEKGSEAFLLWRLQRITSASILEPISTLLNCSYGNIRQGLVDDPAMREIFNRLLQEAHTFAQSFFPKISLREVYTWVWERIERSPPLTDTIASLTAGHVTNVEEINGNILRCGKECGFSCETHEQMIKLIKEKADIEAIKRQDFLDERRSRFHQAQTRSRDQSIVEREQTHTEKRKDRLQVKREKKELSQKERLGNRPMLEHFASPQTQSPGNSKISQPSKSGDAQQKAT
ncbi:hypothetical protein L207DRAFT_573105 [Hyaloscypha variabilis F]|uniref:Ketopantoate reductase C-terminal domain-containing protein n=1 Tax=Hyaloscypha variabilis (strain UAMH 11265 / GT02V1 / F) TaxID=1149755 RepID=A0A2J6QXP2_HYAVF|nr:hypothetical protein L207DRAFT_573105 [Hyaloscypha variabilis F]